MSPQRAVGTSRSAGTRLVGVAGAATHRFPVERLADLDKRVVAA